MPREPTSATLGLSHAPMTEMLTLPCWSICAGLIQMRNRSVKIASKMSSMVSGIARWFSVRNWPSDRVGSGTASMPDSGVDSTARSGACVLFARWAASDPNAVTELTRYSPRSSRAMHVMICSSTLYSVMGSSFGLVAVPLSPHRCSTHSGKGSSRPAQLPSSNIKDAPLDSQPLTERPLAAERAHVVAVIHVDVPFQILVPAGAVARGPEVLLDVLQVRPVLRRAPGEVRPPRRLHDPGDHGAEDVHVAAVRLQALGEEDLLRGQERLAGRLGAQRVHVAVAEDDAVALGIREIDMQERHVRPQGRHRDERFAVKRVLDRRERGAVPQDVRAEGRVRRKKRHALDRRVEPGHHRIFRPLLKLEGAVLAGAPEVRRQAHDLEPHEREDHFRHLAGADQQIDLGAADVDDEPQIAPVAPRERPDQRHRLARQRRAPDGDRGAVWDLRDHLVGADDLVHARTSPRRRNNSNGADTSPKPPSTTIVCPRMYRAPGLQRNATASATSCGCPMRPAGANVETRRSNSAKRSPP